MNAKELILEMIESEETYRKINMGAVANEVAAGMYQSLGMRAGLVNECSYLINKLKVLLQKVEMAEIEKEK